LDEPHATQALTLARHRRDAATTSTATAAVAEFSAMCDGARSPAPLTAAQPLPISDRQREVAEMVATRLSNRQIADQLERHHRVGWHGGPVVGFHVVSVHLMLE